jgi:predicted ribonuclease YlaK
MKNKVVVDTNALLQHIEVLDIENSIIIPEIVLHELDKLKVGITDTAFRARQAVRKLKSKTDIFYDHEFGKQHSAAQLSNDDVIVACAEFHDASLISGDFLAQLKAKSLGVDVYEPDDAYSEDSYCGYKEITMSESEMAYFYENRNINKYNLLTNEYIIIIRESGQPVDVKKWNGKEFVDCAEKNLSTVAMGKFKPLDMHQIAAIDSLITNDITLLRGKAGSGKSLLAFAYAMHQLEKGRINKLICLVNPVPVRGAQEIGFYKGDKNEKLLQSGIGNLLISKLGNKEEVEALIATGRLVLIPFVDIRGYDTGDKSLVWISEAQNLSVDLMKLGLQRIGKGSQIIIDGDDKTQVDSDSYAGINNGIKRTSTVFRGEQLYGEVEFKTIYRSKIAAIADRM